MSTNKSLKHLKSKDRFVKANVSNYFEKHSRPDNSSCIQPTDQATGVSRRTVFQVRKELQETCTLCDEVVIRNNVQEFYIHRHQLQTINNLLSVLKTDIMSTIHQN